MGRKRPIGLKGRKSKKLIVPKGLINSVEDFQSETSDSSASRNNRRLEAFSMNDLIRCELATENNAAGSVTEARCEVPHSLVPSASVSPTESVLRRVARVQELLEREHRREEREQGN